MVVLMTNQKQGNVHDIADNIFDYYQQESISKKKAVSK